MMINELSLETDQTGCFDETGKEMNCRDTGQDGAVKQDRRIEGPDRFAVMNDIVQDKLTGLVWPINAGLAEYPLTWKEAFEFIQEINDSRLSGVNAWRLCLQEKSGMHGFFIRILRLPAVEDAYFTKPLMTFKVFPVLIIGPHVTIEIKKGHI